MNALKNIENELKMVKANLSDKEDQVIAVQKSLDLERDEKMAIIEEKNKDDEEWLIEKNHWQLEKQEFKRQISEMIEASKNDKNARLSEIETNEINQAYHKVLKDKESLENENNLLKNEIKRLQLIINNPNDIDHMKHSVFSNDEDFGYSSSRNTLEKPHSKQASSIASSQVSEGEFQSLQHSNIQNNHSTTSTFERKLKSLFGFSNRGGKRFLSLFKTLLEMAIKQTNFECGDTVMTLTHLTSSDLKCKTFFNAEFLFLDQVTSTPNNSPIQNQDTTVLMLRLRKLLEEEKSKGDSLRNEVNWLKRKGNLTTSTEDSIKNSELEVENEKLRQDYQLLRNSIKRGVEQQELDAQYAAVVEESKRRRDECIQLRSILSQQSQTIRTFASQPDQKDVSMRSYEGNELMEAFQSQKLANKQLESELTALTEEHNMKLTAMMREIDSMRNEKHMLESIVQDKLEIDTGTADIGHDATILRQKESYLRMEVERSAGAYVDAQEQLSDARKLIQELHKRNNILMNRLKENGLTDSILSNDSHFGSGMAAVTRKKAQSYQGILKHQHADEAKILQRLVTDLTPRTAITLLPSLPAYILFMCIRYTDLLNADNQVKTLLTNFILSVKKLYKVPNKVELRILWIVNSISLHNLLKQYGGNEEYMQFNTERQNQQQLKNFDLSEYRQVIHETIVYMYETLVKQIQESVKPLIVPAILYHDETARGKNRRALSAESPGAENRIASEPQSLVNQLEHFYKQFVFFGLQDCYIEQIFQQLFYFICAVALNNLMLRRDLCTWKTGMKLRFNVGCLETWIKQKKMVRMISLR